MIIPPSPELQNKINNTKRLIDMRNAGLISDEELNDMIRLNPDQYLDLETYNNIVRKMSGKMSVKELFGMR